MSETSEVKDCPFCGAAMAVRDYYIEHPRTRDDECLMSGRTFISREIPAWNRRALLRRGESRPATEKEIGEMYRAFGNDVVTGWSIAAWRLCERYHAIGTAPTAHEGGRCTSCGESVPLSEVDSVGGHSRADDDGSGNSIPVHCGPVAPDAAREGISEAIGKVIRRLDLVDQDLQRTTTANIAHGIGRSRGWIKWMRGELAALLAARPAPQAKGSET